MMRKKTFLLCIVCCVLLALGACNAVGKESEPAKAGFVKKETLIGVYDADHTDSSALVAQLIATNLEKQGYAVQIYTDITILPKTGLSTVCVCTKDGTLVRNTLQNHLSSKTKIFFVGDGAIENGIGIQEEAYGVAAVEAIHSDVLERGQTLGTVCMVAQDAGQHKKLQDAFSKQANQYGYAREDTCFEISEPFYTWLNTQAAQSAVGVLALDAQTAAQVAQFSIENGLTDRICIITLGADGQTDLYLRLCAISGILVEDPYALADAAIKMATTSVDALQLQPLLLTRKNIDMPDYRSL